MKNCKMFCVLFLACINLALLFLHGHLNGCFFAVYLFGNASELVVVLNVSSKIIFLLTEIAK